MSVMAQEREQGRLEGLAEGRVKGKADTLLRLLNRRFHSVPEDYRRLVLTVEADQLDTWIDTLLDAKTIESVFGAPTAQ